MLDEVNIEILNGLYVTHRTSVRSVAKDMHYSFGAIYDRIGIIKKESGLDPQRPCDLAALLRMVDNAGN